MYLNCQTITYCRMTVSDFPLLPILQLGDPGKARSFTRTQNAKKVCQVLHGGTEHPSGPHFLASFLTVWQILIFSIFYWTYCMIFKFSKCNRLISILYIGLHLPPYPGNTFFSLDTVDLGDVNFHLCCFSYLCIHLNSHRGHPLQLSLLIPNKKLLLAQLLNCLLRVCLESIHRHFHTF